MFESSVFAKFRSTRKPSFIAALGHLDPKQGRVSPVLTSTGFGIYPIQHLSSTCAGHDTLLSLWSWLPIRITMYQPILLYTSEEHGCSLMTLFTRIENYGPTIMIIKTCSGEVFGAYCSSQWSKRNEKGYHGNRQGYFGTGETFVFTLFPERRKYSWVGLDVGRTQEDLKETATEMFMAADSNMLVIGGGKGQAIYLDADLRFGKTEACQTFNNPPLCLSKDFEIQVIEVYGFAGYDSP